MNKGKRVITAKPISGHNAIEAAGFVVSFARQLDAFELERLLGLQSLLEKDFPIFNKLAGIGVHISNEQVTAQTSEFQGVILQKLSSMPGRPSWVLRVNEASIQVTCGEYDRWENVWPRARSYIEATCQFLNLDSLPVVSIGCQVIDKFVYEEQPEHYVLGDIFNPDSEYLPPRTRSSGKMWHAHQGWFEEPGDTSRFKMLTQLNLSSAMLNDRLTAVIDYINQIIFNEPISVTTVMERQNDKSLLDSYFNDIHDKNKHVLTKLLSSGKLTEIGLAQK
jgi:uncharacterized protein (TIGR04255 family)